VLALLDSRTPLNENGMMVIPGRVKNGVVVLEGGPPLPEGTPVTVSCDLPPSTKPPHKGRVKFPLVRSKRPGSLHLTAQRIAELLEEEDVSP
jgi:hypothetical protein